MSEKIKNHGLNLLTKIIVTCGVVGAIYWATTTFLYRESTNLPKTEDQISKIENTIPTVAEDTEDTQVDAPVSREQLAEGLIIMRNTDISIPESISLAQYEQIIASTSLSKQQIAVHVVGDASSGEYNHTLEQLSPVGPGFLMRGGTSGLQIFMPYLQNILDDSLIDENHTLVRVYVDSITSKSGKNILDSESPFELNSFFNRLKFEQVPAFNEQTDKYYKTEKVLHLKGDQLSIVDDVKQVAGSVVLNLPVSVSKSTLSLDQIVTKVKVKAGNAQVGVTQVKDGAIYLQVKSPSKTIVYVKCFNEGGEVIATSMITAIDPEQFSTGSYDKQSIISFNLNDQVDHVEIYAPKEVAQKKYKFAI